MRLVKISRNKCISCSSISHINIRWFIYAARLNRFISFVFLSFAENFIKEQNSRCVYFSTIASVIYMRAHHFFVRYEALLPAILKDLHFERFYVCFSSNFLEMYAIFSFYFIFLTLSFLSDARCEVFGGRSTIGSPYCHHKPSVVLL